MSVIYFSLNIQEQQGAGLKYYWIRNNNYNFSLSLSIYLENADCLWQLKVTQS